MPAPSEPIPIRPVPLWAKMAIRWRHRRQYDQALWLEAVAFDELVWRNQWDLADSFDELNDRYETYS